MVLEGVEFVQLDIDDLLLAPAWSILWLFGSFRSGSGLYRWSRFFLRFLFDRLFRFLCGSFGLRGCVLVLICFRGTAPALRLFRLFGFFLCFFSEPPAAFPVSPLLPGQAFPRRELPPVPRLSFPS